MKLTIRFAGICTHFLNGVVAGVPHRVVLPYAAKIDGGTLNLSATVAADSSGASYYLLPHFAQLEVPGATAQIDVPPAAVQDAGPPLIDKGDIINGVRLQVLNAVDSELLYKKFEAPRLTDYDPDYSFSSDVVLGGRAACYFDLHVGLVSTIVVNHATQAVVELETDGPPELLVTPLARSNVPVRSYVLPLPGPADAAEMTLIVKNLEPAGEAETAYQQGGAFDFLWHYLTAHGGIPPTVRKMMPGMTPQNFKSATKQELAEALRALATLLEKSPRVLIKIDDVSPSCSDSQYP